MSDGQLAMNTNLVSPGLFLKDSNGDLVKVGPVHVGTTAPNVTPGAGGQAGNSKGEQWLDTSSSRYVFKIWDGTAWRSEDGEFVNTSGDTMTGALGIIAGTAAAPGVFFSGDTNTGIYSPGADTLAFVEGGVEAARIDSSGRLLVGTSSARAVFSNTTTTAALQIEGSAADAANLSITRAEVSAGGPLFTFAKSRGSVGGTPTVVNSGDDLGFISFEGADGTEFVRAASIAAEVDGTPGANDMPGRLVFSTTADGASTPTERMRIDNDGRLLVGTTNTSPAINNVTGTSINPVVTEISRSGGISLYLNRDASNGNIAAFNRSGTTVGTISVTTTATAYNTSSDYRLKENVVGLDGAIARLNQLPVHRFNFKADPDTVVDGFIAHEAQEVVPECVTGEKDEVDDDGNPVMQGIDQSKLVPLLTAALQEALQQIAALTARVTALEA